MTTQAERAIDVVERGGNPRDGRVEFDLETQFEFCPREIESYAFARREPVVYDAMTLAAAVEYADRTLRRPAFQWQRRFLVRVPVYDLAAWKAQGVEEALRDALSFLTGDQWDIEFVRRDGTPPAPAQDPLSLPSGTEAVIAFSDGLDSRCVAGLMRRALGDGIVRVRLGSASSSRSLGKGDRQAFAGVPYSVKIKRPPEASARSRGFKFALLSGVAAYLCEAPAIIVPESGQGALGPALVPSGAYPDYRNHPAFTARMQKFLVALFGHNVRFEFPRLWSTKGQTLLEYSNLAEGADWPQTRSCWRDQRWCSLDGHLVQCGVCAACLLRRMSVHAAGLSENPRGYAFHDLSVDKIESATHPGFRRVNGADIEYSFAGALHIDHLAELSKEQHRSTVRREAVLLARSISTPIENVEGNLRGLIERHAFEWQAFLEELGDGSFVKKWVRGGG